MHVQSNEGGRGARAPWRLVLVTSLLLAAVLASVRTTEAAARGLHKAGSPAAPSCLVQGKVLATDGVPLANARVRLLDATSRRTLQDTVTSVDGSYAEARTSAFASTGMLQVQVRAEDRAWPGSRPGLFRVTYHDVLPTVESAPIPVAGGCRRQDFVLDGVDRGYAYRTPGTAIRWGQVALLYTRSLEAERVAQRMLGVTLDYGLPISVRGWCDESGGPCSDPGEGMYAGTNSGRPVARYPFVALGAARVADLGGGHDMSLAHEFGHLVMADAFHDSLPSLPPSDRNHGGNAVNLTTTDGWVEGWATFYAALVARAEGTWHPGGVEWGSWAMPLELDTQTRLWDNGRIGEEMAVAGALYDMVDGPADYAAGRPLAARVAAVIRPADPSFVGPATQLVAGVARGVDGRRALAVRLQLYRGKVRIGERTRWLGQPDATGSVRFVVPVPAHEHVTSARGRIFAGWPTRTGDDDPMQVTPRRLWRAIVRFRRHRAVQGESSPAVFRNVYDIADMRAALDAAFPMDSDHDGVSDVDEILIRHGLFADRNGNHRRDPGEEIGSVAPPVAVPKVVVPAPQRGRHAGVTTPGRWTAHIIGAVAPRTILVDVAYPVVSTAASHAQGYQYLTTSDQRGRLVVAVPPSDSGATVTLVAEPGTPSPALLDVVRAATFWNRTAPNSTYLRYQSLAKGIPRKIADPRRAARSVNRHPLGWLPPTLLAILLLVAAWFASHDPHLRHPDPPEP